MLIATSPVSLWSTPLFLVLKFFVIFIDEMLISQRLGMRRKFKSIQTLRNDSVTLLERINKKVTGSC